MAKNVTAQMTELLDHINKEVEQSAKTNIQKVAKEAAQKLKNTSPRQSGAYAKGWRSKRVGEMDAVTYNATMPGLAHLLENGHVIRNKKGTYGRTSGIKHIAPVEEWAVDELPRRIIEDIP